MEVLDRRRRPLRDLRISVTDRCNFRCVYCMPKEVFGPGFRFLPRAEILTFEEIARAARVAVSLGVRKIRLTGGEPLLRRDLPNLVYLLSVIPGLEDLALTTNGALLGRQAEALAAASLKRVTVSLDTVDPGLFKAMTGVGLPLGQVLEGIAAASRAGLGPIKLNAVIRRGLNDGGLEELAGFAREGGHTLRLIEYMDVGESHGWRLDEVVPAPELLARLHASWPLEAVAPSYPGEVANRYRYLDGGGEVGVIASVSSPFCGGCTRLRLSADGQLHSCLFAESGFDLRSVLRACEGDEAVSEAMMGLWARRTDNYSERRKRGTVEPGAPKREMSYLGG